jgi:sec-independent protein translocase protein TatA
VSTLTTLALLGPLGVPELLMILLIVVLIFGASKLPLLGKGLGEGIRNFKKGIKSDDSKTALKDGQEAEE